MKRLGTAPEPLQRKEATAPPPRPTARWFWWIFGLTMLGTIILIAFRFSEQREFVRIATRAQPWWLSLAILLQAATYLAEGESWRLVMRAARIHVPLSVAYKLSLAKLFVDQALPSAGISGTVVVAGALEARGVPRPVLMASMVVDTVAFYSAYVLCLGLALVITVAEGHSSPVVYVAFFLFTAVGVVLSAAVLILSGRKATPWRWISRAPLLRNVLALLQDADPQLSRNVRLIVRSGLCQGAIFAVDTLTMWIVIRSLGERASGTGVFASFMVSSLLRTVGVIPGGLGTFEAASIVTLKLVGVPVAVALSGTLLFRGLSFWLPMIPGLLFSQAARPARR